MTGSSRRSVTGLARAGRAAPRTTTRPADATRPGQGAPGPRGQRQQTGAGLQGSAGVVDALTCKARERARPLQQLARLVAVPAAAPGASAAAPGALGAGRA